MFGYAQSEVLGESLQLLMPEAFRRRHQNGINRQAAASKGKTSGKIKQYNNICECCCGMWACQSCLMHPYFPGQDKDGYFVIVTMKRFRNPIRLTVWHGFPLPRRPSERCQQIWRRVSDRGYCVFLHGQGQDSLQRHHQGPLRRRQCLSARPGNRYGVGN